MKSSYGNSPEDLIAGSDDVESIRRFAMTLLEERTWLSTAVRVWEKRWQDLEQGAATGAQVCRMDKCGTMRDPGSETGVCAGHLREVADDYHRTLGAARIEEKTLAKANETTPVVYYVQLGKYIKIGTTRNLAKRMATFYAAPEQVLAVEPGGQSRERERHKQFAHLRHRGELFQPGSELLGHVKLARDTFGDPVQFL